MRSLFLLLLLMTRVSFAQELQVLLENDKTETSVVVTPLDEAPEDIPFDNDKEEKKPPRWWKISLFGLGLAPIEFFISTALHEGGHAAIAKASGVEVTGFHPYPHRHHPEDPFYFGDVHWRGIMTADQRALTLAAPMFLDSAVIGTYGGLLLGNALPKNRYAHMAIWVFAAGHWVDMSTHILGSSEHTDTQRIERYFQNEHGLSVTQSRLAVRGSQAMVLAAGGFFLYKGFRQIFKDTAHPAYQRIDHSLKPKKKKKKGLIEKHELYLSPTGSKDGLGLTFGGKF